MPTWTPPEAEPDKPLDQTIAPIYWEGGGGEPPEFDEAQRALEEASD